MKLTKKEISENTSVQHVKGFGAHAVKAYDFSTWNGLETLTFHGATHDSIILDYTGNQERIECPSITCKKDFVDAVHEYFNG